MKGRDRKDPEDKDELSQGAYRAACPCPEISLPVSDVCLNISSD